MSISIFPLLVVLWISVRMNRWILLQVYFGCPRSLLPFRSKRVFSTTSKKLRISGKRGE